MTLKTTGAGKAGGAASTNGRAGETAHYYYDRGVVDAVARILRKGSTSATWQRQRESGIWTPGLQGPCLPLHDLVGVLAGIKLIPDGPVFIFEDERQCDEAIKLRPGPVIATALPPLAYFDSESAKILKGRIVVLAPRLDRVYDWLPDAARMFAGVGIEVRQGHPGMLDQGLSWTVEAIREMAEDLPAYIPPPAEEPDPEEADDGVSSVSSAPDQGTIPKFLGPPRPIVVTLRPVPEFDVRLLPVPLQAWIADIADRMQCAMDFPAIAAIVALAALVGRKIAIRPKRHDNWTVVANLWGMVVGRPGVLKSPAVLAALDLLKRIIAEALERHAKAMAEHKEKALIAAARKDGAKKELGKAAHKRAMKTEEEKAKEKQEDAQKAEARLKFLAGEASGGAEPEPVARRYMTSDCTVEKLGELLAENPNGMLVYRDELSGFLRSLDKQGHESDRAFYLEGWNGNGSYTCDRIGRGTTHVEAVCLSILGSIQPGPLTGYIRSAASGDGDDGLVSRFQLAVYPNQDRPFRIVDRKPDVGAKNRAMDIYRAVDEFDPSENYSGDEDDDGDGLFCVHFADDAQEFFYKWLTDLETTKLRGAERPILESHLSKFRSLMPSLALLFHLVDMLDPFGEGRPRAVSLESARRAAAWCALLEEHARRIYQTGSEGDMGGAQTLAERIASLSNPFKARDVQRKQWTGLTGAEDVERALGVLEQHGWVVPVDEPPGPKGGRPTVNYHVNPAAAPAATEGEGRP